MAMRWRRRYYLKSTGWSTPDEWTQEKVSVEIGEDILIALILTNTESDSTWSNYDHYGFIMKHRAEDLKTLTAILEKYPLPDEFATHGLNSDNIATVDIDKNNN